MKVETGEKKKKTAHNEQPSVIERQWNWKYLGNDQHSGTDEGTLMFACASMKMGTITHHVWANIFFHISFLQHKKWILKCVKWVGASTFLFFFFAFILCHFSLYLIAFCLTLAMVIIFESLLLICYEQECSLFSNFFYIVIGFMVE